MIGRLLALIKKEFLAIKNDKKSLFVVIVPPLIQLIIFSSAATMELKQMNIAIFDQDGTPKSHALLRELQGSTVVNELTMVYSYAQGAKRIDQESSSVFLVIPKNFAKNLGSNHAQIQLILDGRHANTAQIAESYITAMVLQFQASLGFKSPVEIATRNFYNPNLNNYWWIVPHLFGSITMIVAMILTSLSIARERELGTFEQILVSPLTPFEILLGKLLPALIISVVESSIIILIALYIFHVPLNGSLWLLYLGVFIFLFSMSGVGLFVSSISRTQQQAILGSFVILLPSMLLSGFATPVQNIPTWLQPLSDFIPLTYYLTLIKGVFLKDISFAMALPELIPMLLLGIVSMGVAMYFFRMKKG